MRKRSGGLHCETQQQFIQLAQLSQQKCGLYYDDELNRKKSELNKSNKSRAKNNKTQNKAKPPSKPSVFMDFDFNEDDIQDKQTIIELTKSSNKHLCINITIICSNPSYERMEMQSIMQENQQGDTFAEGISFDERINKMSNENGNKKQKSSEQRLIELYIHKMRREESEFYTAYKFWFVRINSINPEICSTYLNISTQLFRISHEKDQTYTDLQQHPLNSGKRHLIRDVKDISQMLSYIRIGDSFLEQQGQQYSLFSPQYLSNEEEFNKVWNNDQKFEGRR